MKLFNLMMSRDLGGIQQAYVDLSKALRTEKHDVINITSIRSRISSALQPKHRLLNLGSWCWFSKLYLLLLFLYHRPNLIICHGNRAIIFSKFAQMFGAKLVGITHNESYKYLKNCDHILTLTEKLQDHLIEKGFDIEKLHRFSNMIQIQKVYEKPKVFSGKSQKIVIGAFGRLINKKGFSDLIYAVAILKSKGFNISLLIGGQGAEKRKLEREVKSLHLQREVEFCGWVKDKEEFFQKVDVFCLPSHVEAFGIVILEAMARSKPVVATRSGGPEEIIENEKDGLLAAINSPEELANNIQKICEKKTLAAKLSKNAYNKLQERYESSVVAARLSGIIKNISKI